MFKVDDTVSVPAEMFGPLRDSGWVVTTEGNWVTVYVEAKRREITYHVSHVLPLEAK